VANKFQVALNYLGTRPNELALFEAKPEGNNSILAYALWKNHFWKIPQEYSIIQGHTPSK